MRIHGACRERHVGIRRSALEGAMMSAVLGVNRRKRDVPGDP